MRRRTPFAVSLLIIGLVLLLAGVLVPNRIAFTIGALVWGLSLVLIATSGRELRPRRTLATPGMDDLVSGVREQDRALRDGVWVGEYSMRDDSPRRITGYVALALALPVLARPVYYLLAGIAGGSPIAAAALVCGVALGLAFMLRPPSEPENRRGRALRGE